jgi:hypothetical protein
MCRIRDHHLYARYWHTLDIIRRDYT